MIETIPAAIGNISIAVVIPSFRVRRHILAVISGIGPEVTSVYVVDDACPEQTGRFVEQHVADARVKVVYNPENRGVGGATLAGMKRAAEDGAEIIVKIDGDGQMDPALIPTFAAVIALGEADYTKGNRFFEPEGLFGMPKARLIGNAGISFMAKISTGYWHLFDPTNGFIAIHSTVFKLLPQDKIARRYFFESDMLFRLNILTARVADIPIHSSYGDEVSNLRPTREISRFTALFLVNFFKRIVYNYFVRSFSVASLELLAGLVLVAFGTAFGIANWGSMAPATAGTVMTAALPIIVGTQLLLAFLNFDIQMVPRSTLHLRMIGSAQPMRALTQRPSRPVTQESDGG